MTRLLFCAASALAIAATAVAAPVELVAEWDVGSGVFASQFSADFGALSPGEVVNILPQNTSSKDRRALLARPAPDRDILVRRVDMEIVDSSNVSLPLDTLYVHHFLLFSASHPTNASEAALARPDRGTCQRDPEFCAVYAQRFSLDVGPCGNSENTHTVSFTGGGAEFRGKHKRAEYEDKRWAEPAGTVWLTNMHLIDLRNVTSVRDAVQCNCAAYAAETDFVEAGPGGGIQCCPDGARSPTTYGDAWADAPTRAVRFAYTVYWSPLDSAAADDVPHVHVATYPISTGASGCGYQYNARADCAMNASASASNASAEYWQGAEPTNQTCPAGGKETLAVGRSFTVPENVTWNVTRFDGHLHIGGLRLQLVVDGEVVCASVPTYGAVPGELGNEAGFLTDMSGCGKFALEGGSTFHVEAVYSAEVEPTNIAWGVPYEGVMGYAQFHIEAAQPGSGASLVIPGRERPAEGGAEPGCVAQLSQVRDNGTSVSVMQAAADPTLANSVVLCEADPQLELLWGVAGDEVTLALRSDQVGGWFAVGLHDNAEAHGMAGADMIVARIREGLVDVEERTGEGFITPALKLAHAGIGFTGCTAERTGGVTDVRVTRPLQTLHGVNVTEGATAAVIWAFDVRNDFGYHGPTARGHVEVTW